MAPSDYWHMVGAGLEVAARLLDSGCSRPVAQEPAAKRTDHDSKAGVGSMHDLGVADVDADVLVMVEEDEVSHAKVTAWRMQSGSVLVEADARQTHAKTAIDPLHEPGAVKSARRFAAPQVGPAELALGQCGRTPADRGAAVSQRSP